MDRADHIEQMHDEIKFNCIEDTFYQYYDKNVTTDYITQNLLADEQAMGMMKAIFPKCFKNWLVTYCGIVYYGLVRSIAVVHPLINIARNLFTGNCSDSASVEKKSEESGSSDDVSCSFVYCRQYDGSCPYHHVSVTLYDLWLCPVLPVWSYGGDRVDSGVALC